MIPFQSWVQQPWKRPYTNYAMVLIATLSILSVQGQDPMNPFPPPMIPDPNAPGPGFPAAPAPPIVTNRPPPTSRPSTSVRTSVIPSPTLMTSSSSSAQPAVVTSSSETTLTVPSPAPVDPIVTLVVITAVFPPSPIAQAAPAPSSTSSPPNQTTSKSEPENAGGSSSGLWIGAVVFVSILIGSILLTALSFFAIRWHRDRRNGDFDNDSPLTFALWDHARPSQKDPNASYKMGYGELESASHDNGSGSPGSQKAGNLSSENVTIGADKVMQRQESTVDIPPPLPSKTELSSDELKRFDILKLSGIGSPTLRQQHLMNASSQPMFFPPGPPPAQALPHLPSHGHPYAMYYPMMDDRMHSYPSLARGIPRASYSSINVETSSIVSGQFPSGVATMVIQPTNPGMPIPPVMTSMFQNMNNRRASITRSEPDDRASTQQINPENVEQQDEPSSAPEALEHTPLDHPQPGPSAPITDRRLSVESLPAIVEETPSSPSSA